MTKDGLLTVKRDYMDVIKGQVPVTTAVTYES